MSRINKPSLRLWFPWLRRECAGLLIASAMGSVPAGALAAEPICSVGPQQAAAANAQSVKTLVVSPFGRPEIGWKFYEPLIANEAGTNCPAESAGFADALARWQGGHALEPTGILNELTLDALKQTWQLRRPFVLATREGCPDAPQERMLQRAAVSESYGGKVILLHPKALAAYRRMAEAARKAGLIPQRSPLFTIFSGYRSPAYDAARCARENNCQGLVRATCSAHRTGWAMDINLGAAPGFTPDSSADANRLYISQTPLYRWLVRNASRFGFVNYAFEPWHWEFVETAHANPGAHK
jgi:zinc D-Ala-D-Ala carboxypeptidase